MILIKKISFLHWFSALSMANDTPTKQDQWPDCQSNATAYTLKHWPEIGARMKTAGNYRALSLLSHEPTSFENIKRCMQGSSSDAVRLLQFLERRNALEIMHTEWKVSDQNLKQSLGEKWLH